MRTYGNINRILIFITLLSFIFSRVEEGNIYLPMYSNFTLKHSQNKENARNSYIIPIKIGSPAEVFNLQIDTSTATTWVPSSNCQNCVLSTKLYKESLSNTASPTNNEIELEDDEPEETEDEDDIIIDKDEY